MSILIGIFEQGLIFSIAALGVYITYKILDFPDLSVDGTFALGASITAVCIVNRINPFSACLLSFLFGSIGGLLTGILHIKIKINNLLSGILVMMALYSINLRIMTKPNIPLMGQINIFSYNINSLLITFVFMFAVKVILDIFLKTKLGYVLKAVGDNEQLVTSLGLNKNIIKILGLMLSNGLVSLSGSITSQYQGFSDVGMGSGVVIMGLAAVIIGESIFKKIKFIDLTTMVVMGSIFYKASITLALLLGLSPTDLKLVTTLIVIVALSLNNKPLNLKLAKICYLGGARFVKDSRTI